MRRLFNTSERAALRDVAILKKWEECAMPAEFAARKMAQNNSWQDLTANEFIRIANSLGYFRGMAEEIILGAKNNGEKTKS